MLPLPLPTMPHLPSSPKQPLIYFVSMDIPLLDISWNVMESYRVFVTGFFHLIYFQGSSILRVCIPFIAGQYPTMWTPHFVYPFFSRWMSGLFPPFNYCEQYCYKYSCTSFAVDIFLSLLGIYLRAE